MDISLGICFPKMKFCIVGHKILLGGSLHHFVFDLGLSFYFILKKRETFGNFQKLFFSRLHKRNGSHVRMFHISMIFMKY